LILPENGRGPAEPEAAKRALTLNRSGRAIWDLCDGARSIGEITDALAAHFSADREVLARDVLDTLAKFSQLGIVGDITKEVAMAPATTFVIGVEDKPYHWWQTALFLESFRGKLPAGWQTIVVVCNNGEPLSDDIKQVLAAYETKFTEARNFAKAHPLDAGSEAGSLHAGLNRVEALSAASRYVDDNDTICLLDSDTFLYRDLNLDIMPQQCALPRNWHIDHEKFFSTTVGNDGNGIKLRTLLDSIGCDAEFKPGGVNVFVTGEIAKNAKFVADCFRFAQVLFLLGRIAGLKKIWIAEMPCFALALTANRIPYDLLENQEFLVPSCTEKSLPIGSIYHYYSDPADFGRAAFADSKWHKHAYRWENFLRSDYRSFLAAAASESATDHEKYFFELAERARKRLYMHRSPPHLSQAQLAVRDKVPLLGLGFLKTKIDPALHERLLRHFHSNIHKFKSELPNEFLLTESKSAFPSLLYQDEEFNQQLLKELQKLHEQWSGLKLKKAACYGIRVYQPGSFLYNHTDRATHVVSSTICVDHRLRNRWPLYIEDLEGQPHEIPVEPGEMVFFEGARLEHGRPYALDGEYYANIFVHYTPTSLTLNPSGGVLS
jgi:Coenzyme PQQ synthesis protein D (PqqD)